MEQSDGSDDDSEGSRRVSFFLSSFSLLLLPFSFFSVLLLVVPRRVDCTGFCSFRSRLAKCRRSYERWGRAA